MMLVPIPILIALGALIAVLVAKLMRSRFYDPLQGQARPPSVPPAKARPPASIDAPASVAAISPELEARIRAMVARNQKVAAIKLARDSTGLGLKDAKDLVEALL